MQDEGLGIASEIRVRQELWMDCACCPSLSVLGELDLTDTDALHIGAEHLQLEVYTWVYQT
jgi:hypothetical protein